MGRPFDRPVAQLQLILPLAYPDLTSREPVKNCLGRADDDVTRPPQGPSDHGCDDYRTSARFGGKSSRS